MEATINYLIQSGLCLLLLYLFYMAVLRSFPRPAYNRLYLLASPIAALAIPLLDIPLPFIPQYDLAPALPAIQLSEVAITGYMPEAESGTDFILSAATIVGLFYSLAVLGLLARLGIQLIRLKKLVHTSTRLTALPGKATVLQTENNYPTFAFLNYIFVNHQHHLTEQEKQQVIAHELAHVKLGHTYDILYYELLTAILWFNPLVWLLKNELRDVHEYQADASVIAAYQPTVYTSLLAKEALHSNGVMIGSYFNRPQVFKRLQMLQKYGQKTGMVRPLLVLPLILVLVLFFSAKEVTADMATLTSPLNQPENPEVKSISEAPGMGMVTVTAPAPENPIQSTSQTPTPAFKEPDTNPEKPFAYVEQMPEFEGGQLELQKFLAKNVRYPKATKEAGLNGLVVANFVVEKDGSVTNVNILKGLDEAANAEATRVIQATSGKWEPGQQSGKKVRVSFTIPLRFNLQQ